MGNVHVSRSLDQDQRIFRYLSFYDLIELLTFSQIAFTCADPQQQRAAFLRAKKEPAFESLAHQSWTLLDHEESIDWYAPDMSQPRICIVSSIRALSESLFTNDTTNVFIEQTYRVIQDSSQSPLWQTRTMPIFQDDTVSIIVSSSSDTQPMNPRPGCLRLLVDLRTLLAGVIVSPDAPIRFVELTSRLVQQTTCAFVSRANRPKESDNARGPHGQTLAYPPSAYATEEAAQFAL